MLLKIISLSVLILSLVACDKGQEATTNEPAKPPAVVAPTPPAPPAAPAPAEPGKPAENPK